MKTKPDPQFTKLWHGHSEALRRQYKKVRRNNDVAAIEEGEADAGRMLRPLRGSVAGREERG